MKERESEVRGVGVVRKIILLVLFLRWNSFCELLWFVYFRIAFL